jgi:hypothetical protein
LVTVFTNGIPGSSQYVLVTPISQLVSWTAYPNNPVNTTVMETFTITLTAPGNLTSTWRRMFFRTGTGSPGFGNALSLVGVNQSLTVPMAAASVVTSPFTVEAWV